MSNHDPHHSFSLALAEKYGVLEAIFISHFQHWIRINKRLKRNLHDGKTWTYQSLQVFQAHFSYLSVRQIRNVLDSLVKKGVIVKGNFNKSKYDRTVWYAFKDESFACSVLDICQNGQMDLSDSLQIDLSKMTNGNDGIDTPIPDTPTDTKTTNNNILLGAEKHSPQTVSSKPLHAKDFYFDFEKNDYEGITEKDLQEWRRLYPSIDLDREILASKSWLISNRSKANKKLWRKYLTGWLGRAEEKAANKAAYSAIKTDEEKNREWTSKMLAEFPILQKKIKIFRKYVADSYGNKEIYFANHTPEAFEDLFLRMTGGKKG